MKIATPYSGNKLAPDSPLVPILNVQIPITEEFAGQFREWSAKTSLDQDGVARLLIELGVVSLKRIFDDDQQQAQS